jgi:hypothetical protein
MLALITSTISPPSKKLFHEKRSSYTPEQRLQHTLATVKSLQEKGITQIYLFDNSFEVDFEGFKHHFNHINIYNIQQYQFNNKSINEHLLLLTGLMHIPDNEPILKISGRYRLNDKFAFGDLANYDFIVRASDFHKNTGSISTRCYMVKNKKILEDVLTHSLYELFGYGLRVVGLRSGINFIKSLFKQQINKESTVAIEMSMARAIKFLGYSYNVIPLMGLEGFVAGSTDFVYE